MQIRQLPESLANKIAAGEVIERPASVVKELIDNSSDANSDTIKIELKEAGLTFIKVTDNGDGIAEEEVKRAFLRHATSKIQYDADLFHIKTLGFRGEALASIASVSKLTLKTSQGKEAGTELYLEAGKIIEKLKSDARKGTEITVQELFFNTPARLKYMKSIHTELSHITDLINRYALARPDIRFEVIHNEKNIFTSAGTGNMLHVIGQIYGMQVARNMLQVNEENVDFKITGFIAKPEITRSNRNYMTIIMNGRYIRSQPLTYTILRAYDTLLPRHRFPVVVLSITLDPILVDVNVHPTKLEVRISKEKELISLIEQMIQAQFRQTTLIPEITREQQSNKSEQKALHFKQSMQHEKDKQHNVDKPNEFANKNKQLSKETIHEKNRAFHETDKLDNLIQPTKEMDKRTMALDPAEGPSEEERIPTLYPIGQLHGTYILAQNENGFYMIDQHAAQERIKYEQFKYELGKPIKQTQQLLIPMTLEFTNDECMLIDKNSVALEKVGLTLEKFGTQTYIIRSFPNWFPEGLEESLVRDMIQSVIEEGTVHIEKVREELAILMSCKRSIKANHYLNESEMNTLLADLNTTKDPFTCPHGRPVIIHFTTYEIEKMFKRIM